MSDVSEISAASDPAIIAACRILQLSKKLPSLLTYKMSTFTWTRDVDKSMLQRPHGRLKHQRGPCALIRWGSAKRPGSTSPKRARRRHPDQRRPTVGTHMPSGSFMVSAPGQSQITALTSEPRRMCLAMEWDGDVGIIHAYLQREEDAGILSTRCFLTGAICATQHPP